MKKYKKNLTIILSFSNLVLGFDPAAMIVDIQTMLGALGALLLVIMGLKWMSADNSSERAESKKGILYIVIGVLIAYLSIAIVQQVYCNAVPSISC